MEGLCECGCGGLAPIAKRNKPQQGHVKGEPMRFIHGHNNKGKTGNLCPMFGRKGHLNNRWNGGRHELSIGYIMIYKPDHPDAIDGYVYEHRLVAEKALGKHLPQKAEIHHVNEIKAHNRNDNLVICENSAYHKLLHVRSRALKECGHAGWRRCNYCKRYDRPGNLSIYKKCAHHAECLKKYSTERRVANG